MQKNAETVQPGDIFISEYGDYGNFCKFVFLSCEPYKDAKNCTKINVRSVNYNNTFSIYEFNPIDKIRFEVIGNENTNNN